MFNNTHSFPHSYSTLSRSFQCAWFLSNNRTRRIHIYLFLFSFLFHLSTNKVYIQSRNRNLYRMDGWTILLECFQSSVITEYLHPQQKKSISSILKLFSFQLLYLAFKYNNQSIVYCHLYPLLNRIMILFLNTYLLFHPLFSMILLMNLLMCSFFLFTLISIIIFLFLIIHHSRPCIYHWWQPWTSVCTMRSHIDS